jgi:putative peptidoglycan lipid II flippase
MALQGYAIGLCAYSALKILTPAFYAIDRRRTPMMVSFFSIALNIGANYFFAFYLKWGVFGLALGTGCVAVANSSFSTSSCAARRQRLGHAISQSHF